MQRTKKVQCPLCKGVSPVTWFHSIFTHLQPDDLRCGLCNGIGKVEVIDD